MIRRSTFAVGALLGAFHLWLLGHQAWSGQLADPATVLRWLVALVLLVGLASLRRRGVSMVFGRPAVAMWVLAAMLHGPALANDLNGIDTPALPEAVATVAQAAAAIAAVGLALLALAVLAGWAAGVAAAAFVVAATSPLAPRDPSGSLAFLPRPPPLA